MKQSDIHSQQQSAAPTPALDLVAEYVDALAQGDSQAMDALCSEDFALDFVHRDAFGSEALNPDQSRAFWPSWFAGFPEMDYRVSRTVAAEALVVTEWVFTGTNSAPLNPPVFEEAVGPTGRTIRLRGISVFDVQDGCIQRETIYLDLGTLLVELGVSL